MGRKNISVAITGGIGSGKSTFSGILTSNGFPVIFADEISKEILEKDSTVADKVKELFGQETYRNGKLDKMFLADKIFSDPVNLSKINSLLHPLVIKEIEKQINLLSIDNEIVFVEAALIYEADMEKMFDYVVLITADTNKRKERLLQSKRISEEDFKRRDANQISDEEKMKRVDFIFYNNGSVEELKDKSDLLLLTLKSV
jgi:dephospho-CoA kinase